MTQREFDRVAIQKYTKALREWHIKQRDKQVIKRVLKAKCR